MTNTERLWFLQNEYRQPNQQPFGLGRFAGQLGTGPVYRFIVVNTDGSCDTGANRPGCSSALGDAAYQAGSPCDPQHFGSLNDAVCYARAHGEIPVHVSSGAEAFAYADGKVAVPQAQIIQTPCATAQTSILGGMSTTTMLALAAGAYFLLKKKLV